MTSLREYSAALAWFGLVLAFMGEAQAQRPAAPPSVAVVLDTSRSMCGYLGAGTGRGYSRLLGILRTVRDVRGDRATLYHLDEHNGGRPVAVARDNAHFSDRLLNLESASREHCPLQGQASPVHGALDASLRSHDLVLFITDGLVTAGNRTRTYEAVDQWLQAGGDRAASYSLGLIGVRVPFDGTYWTEQTSNCCAFPLTTPERPVYVFWYARSGALAGEWVAEIRQQLGGGSSHFIYPMLFSETGAEAGISTLKEQVEDRRASVDTLVIAKDNKPRAGCMALANSGTIRLRKQCSDGRNPLLLSATNMLEYIVRGLPSRPRTCTLKGDSMLRDVNVVCNKDPRAESDMLTLRFPPSLTLPAELHIAQALSTDPPPAILEWTAREHPTGCSLRAAPNRPPVCESNTLDKERTAIRTTFELGDWVSAIQRRALAVVGRNREIQRRLNATLNITISQE